MRKRVVMLGFLLLTGIVGLRAQQTSPGCGSCAVWNAPQKPIRIWGDTYYVGPHGLSSVLITSAEGHVLIDGALPESAQAIAANIRALGLRVEDIKLIVNSHVHFDHAGGIAELQRMSGAKVMASEWSATVLREGGVSKDDPQFGQLPPLAKVANVGVVRDGETLHIGPIALTAHATPGHTPGGTSWTWRACEDTRCMTMVYADSLSAVSAPGYKFTDEAHADLLAGFTKSFAFLDTTPCDILITPHPDACGFWDRRIRLDAHDTLIDPAACRTLAANARKQLQERIEPEKK